MAIRSNITEFLKEVYEFKNVRDAELLRLHKAIILEALTRLVQKTPVDTGRARGNWQATIDVPAEQKLPTTDKAGGETISRGLAVLGGLKPYGTFWITNNVDYIEFLENGSSKQAPAGMLAVTVEELRAIFK